MKNRTWRKVHRRDSYWDEKATMGGRSFSWSRTEVHKITLECGHVATRRGYKDPPQHQMICKDCEAGKKQTGIEGIEGGVFDHRDKEIQDPFAKALLANECEKAQMRAQVKKRPDNYADLSPREQWAVDKRLGILDYDGA